MVHHPGLGQAKGWSQELHLDFPYEGQELKCLRRFLLFSRHVSRKLYKNSMEGILIGTPIRDVDVGSERLTLSAATLVLITHIFYELFKGLLCSFYRFKRLF